MVDFEGFFSDSPYFRESLSPYDSSVSPYDSSVTPSSDDDSISPIRIRQRLQRVETDMSILRLGASADIVPLSDEQLLTCPPLVPMYSFSVRRWCLAFIDDLSPIDWKPDVLKELQIDGEIKTAIQGLVHGFSAHATTFDDFIDGKGQGLVFLLHGPPGCGKTMTAGEFTSSYRLLPAILSKFVL